MGSSRLSTLSNPLATAEQLSNSASQLDGLPVGLERALRFQGCLLTQAAGILLRLSQDIISQAVVTFTRFFAGPEGGSFREHAIEDISAAALFMTAKLSATPQTMRSISNIYTYLKSSGSHLLKIGQDALSEQPQDPTQYTLSEGEYMSFRQQLIADESVILRQLSYTTRVHLPHPLALTYIQTLFPPGSAIEPAMKRSLATRTIAILNTALLSPQLLYLTHQPHALAVGAIYLAAREIKLRISNDEWWLVWDVTREELGFLVLAFRSMETWIQTEYSQQQGPLFTTDRVDIALQLMAQEQGGAQAA